MIYWVLVRSITEGDRILYRYSFTEHKDALAKMAALEEAPDPEGHDCRVEMQILWPFEAPK